MDTCYIKAFVICGTFTCIGTIILYGPRRFFAGNNPFKVAIAAFVFGVIGGALLYPILSRMGSEWWFWKW